MSSEDGTGGHARSVKGTDSQQIGLFEDVSDGRLCPSRPPRFGATIPGVAASPTKRVEFDSELLERLHQRRPEMSDRELLESMARMTLGRETLRRVQERNTLSEDEAIELGVKAVHEARRERRATG